MTKTAVHFIIESIGRGETASELIARLDAAGFVIVPKEPTEAMYAAAERDWDGRMSARSRGVWQAMIAAAQQQDTAKS